MQSVPGLELELRAGQPAMGKVQEPREQRVAGRRAPVTWIRVQPDVERLDEGLAVLRGRDLVERVVPLEQELEDLAGRRERPVGGQEDVYVGRLELAVVVGQALDQTLHRAGLEEAHAHRLPF